MKLLELYASGLSSKQVSKIIGCSHMTVVREARKAGIIRRTGPTVATLKKRGNSCLVFRKEFVSYLDGLLISDGSITKPNGCSVCASYRQHCVKLQWLKTINKNFSIQGIKSRIDCEIENKIWNLRTLHYDQLAITRMRWYPHGHKIIPKDLEITPCFIKNWIYGDGSLGGIYKKTLTLATDSFHEDDVDWIIQKLNTTLSVGFKKNYRKESKTGEPQFRLTLCLRDGLQDLYKYAGDCDISCFQYKWIKMENNKK